MAASPLPSTLNRTDQPVSVVLAGFRKSANAGDFFDEIAVQLRALRRPYHLILVDDGSGVTGQLVAEAARAGLWLEVVRHGGRRTLSGLVHTGLQAAVRHGGVVVTLAAHDTQHPPLIQSMLERVDEGHDVVIASRFAANGSEPERLLPRSLVPQAACAVLRRTAPLAGVRDYGSVYRAYRADLLERVLQSLNTGRRRHPAVPWTVSLLLEAGAQGARMTEVPLMTVARVRPTSMRLVPMGSVGASMPATEPRGAHPDLGCRLLSVSVAAMGIVLTAPLMVVIGSLIKLTSPGPIMYTQPRIGADRRARNRSPENCRRRVNYCGRPFRIYKFRTMSTATSGAGNQVWARPDDPRVTSVGRFLRKYRLDELPQMFNVLWGDMNIVGPRPEQPGIVMDLRERIERYDERHRVPPGITGWAQVNQHYDSSIDDVRRKVYFDLEYVARRSAFEDLKIMLRTLPVMLFQRGAW